MTLLQLGLGLLLGVVAALLALRLGMLTKRGAIAAAAIGTLTFGVGGLAPSILLLGFFFSSSLLSRTTKPQLTDRTTKGATRDEWQVLANGAVPTLFAIGYGLTDQAGWIVGAAGALAASNADTWATEIGVLSPRPPRLITNWNRVEAGTSGAVSLTGTVAALAGALLIGLLGSAFAGNIRLLYVAGTAGLLASLLDSVLGATLQASYYCPSCEQFTEQHPTHRCGIDTVQVRGWSWLGNDQVNLMASIAGALLAYGIWMGLG